MVIHKVYTYEEKVPSGKFSKKNKPLYKDEKRTKKVLVEPEEIVKDYFYSCRGIEERLDKIQQLLTDMLSFGREQVLKNMTESISLDRYVCIDGEILDCCDVKWEFEE